MGLGEKRLDESFNDQGQENSTGDRRQFVPHAPDKELLLEISAGKTANYLGNSVKPEHSPAHGILEVAEQNT